ncbi:hypothetical protein VTJ49DRAFT_7004 [Mycothermus thermophilus]|uniref:chitinase n=1 Tax=Humicola insolens TaxID=85995 RepID=A0ABR3VIJ7_HUMIN
MWPRAAVTAALLLGINLVLPALSLDDDDDDSSPSLPPSCHLHGWRHGNKVRYVAVLLEGMKAFFDARDNCDENFVFTWHKETAAGVYVGGALGKSSIVSAIDGLAGYLRDIGSSLSNRTVAQLCSSGRLADRSLGIAIDTTADLAALQKTALSWSQGDRVAVDGNTLKTTGDIQGLRVLEVAGEPSTRKLGKRATCRYIEVVPGDGCWALVERCGISTADFYRFNPKPDLCSTLMPGYYICCSEGDPYVPELPPLPEPPRPQPDGTCATHLIQNGDTCDSIARQYGVTIDDLERWNRGKTDGYAPLPPPQADSICGPLVPGTQQPADRNISLASLNPCPLNACCSNWGFCGPFPAHCEIHAPEGGGPGSKLKGYQSTCISNWGNDIKINSGAPATFQRIGYYESFNFERKCLWLSAKRANTDGTYTHMHWAFADIDPNGWKVVIKDPHNQWADFKRLNVKRIVSLGGWAYSTEAATYNIIRQAILAHREEFTTNIAKFIQDEGIDGIDIDWEYPGAPDIYVGDQPIGQTGDGVGYLRFLSLLKQKYLKAFPIDRIAAQIDYIVYMTYDLHGQWDYGNPNAYDSCPSGKCIWSHVNLTETRNTLSIITKAGVPNNKIFVGEASYGRSFRMAQAGCWGPTCDFTGTN